MEQIDVIKRLVEEYPEELEFVTTADGSLICLFIIYIVGLIHCKVNTNETRTDGIVSNF